MDERDHVLYFHYVWRNFFEKLNLNSFRVSTYLDETLLKYHASETVSYMGSVVGLLQHSAHLCTHLNRD